MRQIYGIALTILVILPAMAVELPDPPARFKWQEIPAISGALLVPEGWHFREEKNDGTLAYFITETELQPPSQYIVGASMNVFLGNAGAPAQVEQYLKGLASHFEVSLEPGSFGPFLTLQCQYDMPAENDHPATRVFYMGVVNPDTDATYLVQFEAPVDQWSEAWELGFTIVSMLALSGSV